MTRDLRLAAAAVVVAAVTAALGYGGVALAAAGGHEGHGGLLAAAPGSAPGPAPGGGDVLGPGPVTVEVGIEHSRFVLPPLRVARGTEVRFVLHNGDPIGHELIVGEDAVHERHEGGHEAWHPARPGEVSVAPDATAATTYVFGEAGRVAYACHLPGHYAFGMHGEVEVVEVAGAAA